MAFLDSLKSMFKPRKAGEGEAAPAKSGGEKSSGAKSSGGKNKGRLNVKQRFEILREAISGTMSNFYMARDRQSGEVVGLKILDKKKTQQFEARFPGLKKPTEGEISYKLVHPNIVKTLEYGLTASGEQYLVMEFISGPGLNSLVIGRNRDMLENTRVPLIRQIASALDYVHKSGYIHRDLCPRNVMVEPNSGVLKLIDFGLTVPATEPYMQPGNRTGNPNYMAPELVRRQKTDQRIDVFALGVTCFEICTFELPWSRGLTGAAAMDHATKPPNDIRELFPNLNEVLAEAIMSCLAQDLKKRCPSAEAFLARIKDVEHETA